MKKHYLLLLLLIQTLYSFGQNTNLVRYANWNNGGYEALATFESHWIESDFRPRNYTTGSGKKSFFHSGVDFNHDEPDESSLIGSIEDGIISYIRFASTKRIVVEGAHTFVYTHIMLDHDNTGYEHRTGNCWIEEMVGSMPNDIRKCIVYIYDDDTLAISSREGLVKIENDTIDVVTNLNRVGSTQPYFIGALGGSNGYGPHLHLGSLRNGTTQIGNTREWDPAQYINYDEPTYDTRIYRKKDTLGFKPQYPGTNSSRMMIEPRMVGVDAPNNNGYLAYYDFNDLSIEIKKSYLEAFQFKLIAGPIA